MSIEDKNINYVITAPDAGQLEAAADDFMELIDRVCEWGVERNITAEGGATALSQTKKMFEEVQEFVDAKTDEEAKDAVGDMLVVLIQMCRLRGYDLRECLSGAWDEIKFRKGKMIEGVFVKEA